MIMTFKHNGLRAFFLYGKSGKIQPGHVKKLRLLLASLYTAVAILDMNFPSSGLHQLKGNMKGFWAISVSANWRIIFRFERENAYDVDYVDYH